MLLVRPVEIVPVSPGFPVKVTVLPWLDPFNPLLTGTVDGLGGRALSFGVIT
jgi:hypothetical protein